MTVPLPPELPLAKTVTLVAGQGLPTVPQVTVTVRLPPEKTSGPETPNESEPPPGQLGLQRAVTCEPDEPSAGMVDGLALTNRLNSPSPRTEFKTRGMTAATSASPAARGASRNLTARSMERPSDASWTVRGGSGTMDYKHRPVDHETVLEGMKAPNFILKIMPHVDGSARICELVRFHLEDIVLKEAWTGPAALGLFPHALADVARLPVREVISAVLNELTNPAPASA